MPPIPADAAPTPLAVEGILQAVKAANAAAAEEERQRRLEWEKEQEAKFSQRETEWKNQVAEMRSQLLLLQASVTMQQHPPPPPPPPEYGPPLPEPSAHIEEINTPTLEEQRIPRPLITRNAHANTPQDAVAPPQQWPTFVQGSSSTPLPMLQQSSPTDELQHPPSDFEDCTLPSPAPTPISAEPSTSSASPFPYSFSIPLRPGRTQHPSHVTISSTANSGVTITQIYALPSPALSTADSSPRLPSQQALSRNLGKRRAPPSPSSTYDSDSYSSDESGSAAQPSDAPRKRRNGHDKRCYTIQARRQVRHSTVFVDAHVFYSFSMLCANIYCGQCESNRASLFRILMTRVNL